MEHLHFHPYDIFPVQSDKSTVKYTCFAYSTAVKKNLRYEFILQKHIFAFCGKHLIVLAF